MNDLATDISRHVWETKYRYADGQRRERTIAKTWRRVARALAAVEREDRAAWERRYFGILRGFKFLPGGGIQAGAGTARNVTLFNCFVMGTLDDSIPGIFSRLAGSRGNDAARRRHRLQLLDPAAARRTRDRCRQYRLRSGLVHADLAPLPIPWIVTIEWPAAPLTSRAQGHPDI